MGNTREEKDLQNQTPNNYENGNRNIHIDNYLKREWIKCSNQKTQAHSTDTKTRPIYMLSTRDPLQTWGHIQTDSEGMVKDIPCKWKFKKSWSSNTHMR